MNPKDKLFCQMWHDEDKTDPIVVRATSIVFLNPKLTERLAPPGYYDLKRPVWMFPHFINCPLDNLTSSRANIAPIQRLCDLSMTLVSL